MFVDFDEGKVVVVVEDIGCVGMVCNVIDEVQVQVFVDVVMVCFGCIDFFCFNVGVGVVGLFIDVFNEFWQGQWDLYVMLYFYVVCVVLFVMIECGSGYFLNIFFVVGLFVVIGLGFYFVSKVVVVKFVEFFVIIYGDDGIGVLVFCLQGVNIVMVFCSFGDGQMDGIIEVEELVQCVVEGLCEECFYIFFYLEVEEYVCCKGDDIDCWIGGMWRLWCKLIEG